MGNDKMTDVFSKEDGLSLLRLARKSIETKLKKSVADPGESGAALSEKIMLSKRGTFVSLHKHGELRGCIGNLRDEKSVHDGIIENAQYAAFRDSRFDPVTLPEMSDVVIEVSILTPMVPLDYRDPDDLTAKLKKDVDGVMIRKGRWSATFLPQVWKQLRKPEDFLSHLCMKAGLPADEWQSGSLSVYTYQVQMFDETQYA